MRQHLLVALASVHVFASYGAGQAVIDTVAGGGPHDVPATLANVGLPSGVAVDSAGNLLVTANMGNQSRVFKVSPSGTLTVFAGAGPNGFFGDSGPATDAFMQGAHGVAVDSAGNVFFADIGNHRIRKVDPSGTITTVAGTGAAGYNGDNIQATSANLSSPQGVAVDTGGNLLIADTFANRIRRVDSSGVITTVAGTGTLGYNGDNMAATSAWLRRPAGVTVDGDGNVFIADTDNHRIRKVDGVGIITTVAGDGFPGTIGFLFGDGGPATIARLRNPGDVAVDAIGNLFVADTGVHSIRKVDMTGTITTVAGIALPGFDGDVGPATSARLNTPRTLAVDGTGNLYIGDTSNHRIRRVDTTGTISTVAGNGEQTFSGENVQATRAALRSPADVAIDPAGNLFIADTDHSLVRKVDPAGIITTVAGTGPPFGFGFIGDGGPATLARMAAPTGVAADSTGSFYVADTLNHRIRKVDSNGVISTVAGTIGSGYNGDNRLATSARLNRPEDVTVDANGNLFIADTRNHRVRKVDTVGTITTVAGTGLPGYNGEGILATTALLSNPSGVALDSVGNLFIVDTNRVRRVDTSGRIMTVAGTGTLGYNGDGIPATTAQLASPRKVAVDASGNFYIADGSNSRIRKVDASGIITTVAGNGIFGFSGDGGLAVSARLSQLWGVAVDGNGRLFTADFFNHRIRRVSPAEQASCDVGGPYQAVSCEFQVPVQLQAVASCSDSSTPLLSWNSPDGVSFSNTTVADPSGVAPAFGEFAITLEVSCGEAAPVACGGTITVSQPAEGCNQPPVAICQDVSVSADASCQADASVDNGSYDPNGDPITLTQNPAPRYPLGDTTVLLTVDDGQASDSCFGRVTVVDDTLPVIDVHEDVGAECSGLGGALVGYGAAATDNCSVLSPVCNPAPGSFFPLGMTAVNCTATDPSGNTAAAAFNVAVRDATPPSITVPSSTITAACTSPNGANVSFAVAADDVCSPPAVVCTPASGGPFAIGTTPVNCVATDSSGNATAAPAFNVEVTSTAPTLSGPLTGNPLLVAVGYPVSFEVAFSDNSGDVHTASWEFGDGELLPAALATSPAMASHTYTAQGIYTTEVTITDQCGNAVSDNLVVVVFDPGAGFTTGGGWFVPDADSFVDGAPVTDTISKANFGFIVKYKQGQASPNGNLEFQYKAGDINLHSSQMDWMVTSTSKVRFKGMATINGAGQYTFKVTAEDNGEPGTNDSFKIEIWTGVVDTENAPPAPKHMAKGILGGGNIQIHQ